MADISVDRQQLSEDHRGQMGFRELHGIGAFNSTDATGTLAVQPLTRVEEVQCTPIGTWAADEIVGAGDTPSNGIISPSSGKITIKRTGAAKTSGLKFFFRVRGR